MDAFLQAIPIINGVKIIKEVRKFLTEVVLAMIAFSTETF